MNETSGDGLESIHDDRWRRVQAHLGNLVLGMVGQGLTIFILSKVWPPAAIVVLVASVLMAVSAWHQGQGGSRIVLWLRRFDRPQRKAFRNLKAALRYLGMIITLRDASVPSVKEMTYVRWFNPQNLLFSLRIATVIFLILWIGGLPYRDAVAALTISISLALVIFILKGLIDFRVDRDDPSGSCADIIETLVAHRRGCVSLLSIGAFSASRPFASAAVISCDDDVWRPAVAAVIQRAAIVVVDLYELSPSLEWEIEQAVTSLGLSRVVFLRSGTFSNAAAELVERLSKEQSSAVLVLDTMSSVDVYKKVLFPALSLTRGA